jgi:hypothetical protein
MYDYLAKIILLGPSGSGKYVTSLILCSEHARLTSTRSCLLHRFVKDEWRVLSSQTIGVEFASKIIRVGTGARRKRIKLQVPPPPSLPRNILISSSSGTLQVPNASAPSLAPTIEALQAQY